MKEGGGEGGEPLAMLIGGMEALTTHTVCAIPPKFRGFEKGLAGGGWRLTNPQNQAKSSPEMCPPQEKGCRKEASISGIRQNVFAPTPLSATSDKLRLGLIKKTLPLRPRILVKKPVVLVKRRNAPVLILPGFSVQGRVLVNPFLRFTKTTDLFAKILGLKGKGS